MRSGRRRASASERRAARSVAAAVLFVVFAAPFLFAQRTLDIERFTAAIDVAADGSMLVEERIRARFTGAWNGLYRTIPVEYRRPGGLNYTLRVEVLSITDDAGRNLRYDSSRERHYRKLKIWVPGAVDATRTVVIRYRVRNGLRFFDEHDELYWNVTGDEWDVPIEAAEAVVRLPPGVTGVRAAAFQGAYGSVEPGELEISPPVVTVRSGRPLRFREGLTLAIGWNPGIVRRPTAAERAADTLYANLPLAIPPVVLLVMWRLWRARGRDPELAPVAVRYEPPDGMSPAELGTLADGKPDLRDITSTIVDLAVRGYLHIAEIERGGFLGIFGGTDYAFTLRKAGAEWASLREHERELLCGLFDPPYEAGARVELSDLKNVFYKRLPRLRDALYAMLVERGFYAHRPDRVRRAWLAAGIAAGGLVAVGGTVVTAARGMQPASAIIAGVATGAIVCLFGWFMPARTVRGTRELEKVLGFREFLARVEADRLDRLVRTPELFERFLPYAMALGVEDRWAKAFDEIAGRPPDWYSGPPGRPFRPSAFAGDMSRMSAAAATTMASAPRGSGGSGLGGGGFSGGGFGGGGGGGF
ncbi:MAG TPA: DUF2207 domain-containing protein [Vicinamibacterales bacterium]|nr:DUF2207 domain-containing protein [Vicinamibacterales bacterium]